MITVEYDPINGGSCPDGEVMDMARTLISNGEDVSTSTGLVIDSIRVLVKTGKIRHDQIQFEFNGVTINIDENGRCSPWPEGFNDTVENLLMQL